MTAPYIDPNIIFASEAPTGDKPNFGGDPKKGFDVTRSNEGRPLIKQANFHPNQADLKIQYIHEQGAALPYKDDIDYADGVVVNKDGELQKFDKVKNEWKPTGGARTDAELITWSGRTQEEVNKSLDDGSITTGIKSPSLGTNPNLTPKRYGASIRRPEKTTKDIVLFIDPASGSDNNSGDEVDKPLKTFAEAMSRIPYQVFHKVRVYCLDGIYDEAMIVQFMWLSSSKWANFEIIGHTPENPAYTDLKPENVVFSKTLSTGERQASLWGAMPGSNFNTFLKGVTLDNFWPYDVTMQVWDCIIQRGGGAFNNYAIGGHGGRVGFKRVKFRDFPADGLICEATDFAQFHFDECTLDNVLCPIAYARNNSVVTFERCGFDLSTSIVEPGSFIGGEGSTYINQFGLGKNRVLDSFTSLSASEVGKGSSSYNIGGQLVVYGQDYAGSDAGGVTTYFGSRTKDLTVPRVQFKYANTSGSVTMFTINRFGIATATNGFQVLPALLGSTAGFNNTIFVDAADSKLKFRDSTGAVRTVSLT